MNVHHARIQLMFKCMEFAKVLATLVISQTLQKYASFVVLLVKLVLDLVQQSVNLVIQATICSG